MSEQEKDKVESFKFISGELDEDGFKEYLETLSPESVNAALDRIVNRSTEIDLSDEERKDIVQNIVTKKFHTEAIEVIDGMSIVVRSLSEGEWQEVILNSGEGTTEHSRRMTMLEEIVRSVKSVNGEEMPTKIEDRRKRWADYPPALITMLSTKLRSFHLKIREALSDAEKVKK